MGKQIEFFMTKADELEFLKVVSANNFLIMDDRTTKISMNEAIESNALSLFFTFENAKVYKSNNGFLDVIISEAIQFSRSLNRGDCSIRSGRIWAEFKYYNSSHELTAKSKQMSDMYSTLAKWIKKNMKQSKCKNFYVGNAAYSFYKAEGYSMLAGPKHTVEFE